MRSAAYIPGYLKPLFISSLVLLLCSPNHSFAGDPQKKAGKKINADDTLKKINPKNETKPYIIPFDSVVLQKGEYDNKTNPNEELKRYNDSIAKAKRDSKEVSKKVLSKIIPSRVVKQESAKKNPPAETISLSDTSGIFEARSIFLIEDSNRIGIIGKSALGYASLILISENGGASWDSSRSIPDTSLYHCLSTGKNLFSYGNTGRLWKSEDQGRTWNVLSTFRNLDKITALRFDSMGINGAVAGTNDSLGVVYYTANWGKDWKLVPVIYDAHPENFNIHIYFLLGLLVLILTARFLISYRKKVAAAIEKKLKRDISPLVVFTDNPIDHTKEDLLGFTETEDAIIKLLRNPDTSPPMTIVLNGSWGTGKSSMMSRIKGKLEEHSEFQTMWFNAWHIQDETSMLAVFLFSLVRKMKQNYDLAFKLRLFWNRMMKLDFFSQLRFWFACGIIIPVGLLFLLKVIQPLFNFADPAQVFILDKYWDALNKILSPGLFSEVKQTIVTLTGGIVGLAGILLFKKDMMPKVVSSFVDLIPVNKFKLEIKDQDPGFRERFKREFWEVMKAGDQSKKMVVFIDDLDRVEGDKILQLLETVNFISDTASRPTEFSEVKSSMFFVIGMATEQVVENLGSKLPAARDANMTNQMIGARFLEKMVDLIVSVPSISTAADNKLFKLFARGEENEKVEDREMNKKEQVK